MGKPVNHTTRFLLHKPTRNTRTTTSAPTDLLALHRRLDRRHHVDQRPKRRALVDVRGPLDALLQEVVEALVALVQAREDDLPHVLRGEDQLRQQRVVRVLCAWGGGGRVD